MSQGEFFQIAMKERVGRCEAFEGNPEFSKMLISIYAAVNEMAHQKGMKLEEMEILDAKMEKNYSAIMFRAIPTETHLKNISPILGADGQNIRRSDLA